MVLLHHNFDALLDSGQHPVEVASYFSFGHVHLRHRFDHSSSVSSESQPTRAGLRLDLITLPPAHGFRNRLHGSKMRGIGDGGAANAQLLDDLAAGALL